MKKLVLILSLLFLVLHPIIVATASESAEQVAYKSLFSSSKGLIGEAFSEKFLQALPIQKINEILELYKNQLGRFVSSQKVGNFYRLKFENGTATSTIHLNKEAKISGLWFGEPVISSDNLENIKREFSKLKDRISICLMRDNKFKLVDLNSEKAYPVGSTFKLFLLKAVCQKIEKKEMAWNQLIKIEKKSKSFPSGILQDWPVGTSLTLESMAGLMISLSDNTATDHIFNLLGRETVSAILPETCGFSLNTSEMLKLKFVFKDKAKEFIKASEKRKNEILKEISEFDRNLTSQEIKEITEAQPFLIDELEWNISTEELCKVIYDLRLNKLLTINPAYGLINKNEWHKVCYKGGSEPGVLNYTWFLQKTSEGPVFSLSCSISNPQALPDIQAFNLAVLRLIKHIHSGALDG